VLATSSGRSAVSRPRRTARAAGWRSSGSFRVPGLRFLRPLVGPLERRVGRMALRRLEARVHAR